MINIDMAGRVGGVLNHRVTVATGTFAWPMLLVFACLPQLPRLFGVFSAPKPTEAPASYPEGIWPLRFSANAFRHTRRFTSLFLLGMILDTLMT
ncbi:hypothetical protein BST95_07965 [Halioglobus japonicus]|nr:hypothetical protein [Halioglobus japonicus]AQA18178.1 hypothetical protein BST95_07965 [Halioglobus japonicus]GHD14042.1 hypothetical protein GCM10007052_17260 [Halioglobus japonicus]